MEGRMSAILRLQTNDTRRDGASRQGSRIIPMRSCGNGDAAIVGMTAAINPPAGTTRIRADPAVRNRAGGQT